MPMPPVQNSLAPIHAAPSAAPAALAPVLIRRPPPAPAPPAPGPSEARPSAFQMMMVAARDRRLTMAAQVNERALA